MENRTYALIGGAGVFAIHTAQYLLANANPRKVIAIGRNRMQSSPFTLDTGKGDDRFEYHQIHLVFEQDRLFELFDQEKPDVIINFAALAYATSWNKSFRYYESNVVAVAKMCEDLHKRDYLQRFLQIGTSELYGSVGKPATEDTPLCPTSPYAVSKLAADLHLETLWNVQKFPMNIIRPSNAYGPGQLMYRILPRAVLCGLTGQKLPLQGGGHVKKSYIHAQDLARAIHLIVDKAPLGVTYNAGPAAPVSIREIVQTVADELGMTLDELCDITEGRQGEDAQYWLDSSRIKNDLDWEPNIGLREGVRDMIDWGRKYIDQIQDEPLDFILRA
ncbi:GDP-mannose 4,6-dehydratase [Rhodospirillales bacterium]|nr:GDP-mannose 4,6-dehydratase [Rhodospirillales bacterium]